MTRKNKASVICTTFVALALSTSAAIGAPAKQEALEELVCRTKWDYLEHQNEIHKSRAVATRNRGIDEILDGSYAFVGWEGVIREISVIPDSGLALTISLGCKIRLKTWNNSFSDLSHATLIDIESPIGSFLENAYVGDRVKITGYFTRGGDKPIYESSLTERGRMTEPEYIVTFKSISDREEK